MFRHILISTDGSKLAKTLAAVEIEAQTAGVLAHSKLPVLVTR